MTLIAQVSLQDLPPINHTGINAEAHAISLCLRHAGAPCSFEEVMGVTATAFRTHFFRPRDNPGMRLGPDPDNANIIWGPRWAWSSLRHSNYGLSESAAYYYGGEVRPVTDQKAVGTWKILRFELDLGRPVAAYGLRGPSDLDLIVGYRLSSSPLRQLLLIQTGPDQTAEFDMTGLDPKGDAPFPRELLLVRPGPVGPHRGADDARRTDALRWALFHSHTRRELLYETSRFYATGPFAFEAFSEFLIDLLLDALTDPLEARPKTAPADIARFCKDTLNAWATARRAAHIYLRSWARDAKAEGRPLEGINGGPDALRQLAAFYETAAANLSALLQPFDVPQAQLQADIQRPKWRSDLAQGIEAARQDELRTVAALAMVVGAAR